MVSILMAAFLPLSFAGEKVYDIKAILNKFDDLWRGDSSSSQMTMYIKTRNW